jgi:hypothetical protein
VAITARALSRSADAGMISAHALERNTSTRLHCFLKKNVEGVPYMAQGSRREEPIAFFFPNRR